MVKTNAELQNTDQLSFAAQSQNNRYMTTFLQLLSEAKLEVFELVQTL